MIIVLFRLNLKICPMRCLKWKIWKETNSHIWSHHSKYQYSWKKWKSIVLQGEWWCVSVSNFTEENSNQFLATYFLSNQASSCCLPHIRISKHVGQNYFYGYTGRNWNEDKKGSIKNNAWFLFKQMSRVVSIWRNPLHFCGSNYYRKQC